MTRYLSIVSLGFIFFGACTCSSEGILNEENPTHLVAYDNPFGEDDNRWSLQPRRDKPQEVVLHPNAAKAYVSLPGTPDDPSRTIVVVNTETGAVEKRIEVGYGVSGLALHPDGKWLLAVSRFSNFACVVDTETDEVRHCPPMTFYATEAVFSPDGNRLFITNRWRDSVEAYSVTALFDGLVLQKEASLPVGQNPRDLAISSDGKTLAVAALTGLTVSLIDAENFKNVVDVDLGAPVNGLAFSGDFVVSATLSASTHHLPNAGPDTNHSGTPGDGTPNVNFQDLQNEIAVIHVDSGEIVHRYTSDTICCRDYRDVDPSDVSRRGNLLPPESTWIVEGALPEQVAVSPRDSSQIFVTYSASNEVQSFSIDDEGALTSSRTFRTSGHSPHGLAIAEDAVFIVHRLSESLGKYTLDGSTSHWTANLGFSHNPDFPATDVEIGELVNDVTSFYTVDGDQSCAHCHRETGNIDKAFSMPLTKYGGLGSRMTMAYRGAADTRPWFFESAMDETNFRPVINEFARIENFCCSDYTLWGGATPTGCEEGNPIQCGENNAGSRDGFDAHRGDETISNPRPTAFSSRDLFYLDSSMQLFGRSRSFGDSLFYENPVTLDRTDIPLDFDGITRSLGMFLMATPKLLPNPNDSQSSAAKRGEAIFNSGGTGCAGCHPAPTFAVSTDVNPQNLPLRFGPVVSPNRSASGVNLDLFSPGFSGVFPAAEIDSCAEICGAESCAEDNHICDDLRQVKFGVPSLRGIWDRADSMLHDGRAQSLKEVICTPGHPALYEGETGFNENNGIPNSHGSTSHLSPDEIEDLIVFMLSL
ncbi:MAG: beta-propeller fold lactonase family protein [Deltaproteobacteria bacterium]|nr:beta-propeller fold lactonase family protein [Deltaproteobacteria bacterium]